MKKIVFAIAAAAVTSSALALPVKSCPNVCPPQEIEQVTEVEPMSLEELDRMATEETESDASSAK